jgi:hypothetical protein
MKCFKNLWKCLCLLMDEWMMCLNVKHLFSDVKCGKANWEKLVVEPHDMSMEVDG